MRRRLPLVLGIVLAVLAAGTAGTSTSAARGRPDRFPGGFKHLVVIYEENHSFDNLYGDWGPSTARRSRAGPSRCRAYDSGERRKALRTPACLRTTSTSPTSGRCRPLRRHRAARRRRAEVRQRTVRHRRLHPSDREDLPGTGCVRPARVLPTDYPAGAPGPRSPLLPGAVSDRRRQAGPLRHRQRRYRAGHGLLRHQIATDLRLPSIRGRPELRHRRPLLPGAFGGSFLNHQWLIAARSPVDPSGGAFGGAVHSVLDTNGFPNADYPLYAAHPARCRRRSADPGLRS